MLVPAGPVAKGKSADASQDRISSIQRDLLSCSQCFSIYATPPTGLKGWKAGGEANT